MRAVLRVLVSLVVVVATYYFIFWFPFSLIPMNGLRWIASVVSLLCAVGAGGYTWKRTRSLAGNLRDAAASSPTESIAFWALLIGGVSFAAGFFGPIFLSESNLGPLLGIFITGPLGVLAGALWGCVRRATRSPAVGVSAVFKWVVGIWMITLLYTLFTIRLAPFAALPAVGLQVAVLAAGAFILYNRDVRTWLSRPVRKCGPVVLAMIALIALMTLFPPVTRPWWGPGRASAVPSTSASLPTVAFILHPNFDASRHVPLFAVNASVLCFEWMAALVVGILACSVMARRVDRGNSSGVIGGAA